MPGNNEAEAHKDLPITAPEDHSKKEQTASEDIESKLRKQIQSTLSSHAHEITVTPILQVIKDVLSRASESMDRFISGKSESAFASAGKISWDGYAGILKEYASTINKISCELSCNREADSESTTTSAIFNCLSDYSWDAKVVISLAAFAIFYGDFCLITQLSTTNPLAMSVSLLKQPDITVHASSVLDTIKNLLKAILNVTESFCKFQHNRQISHVELASSMVDDFSDGTAYWTIRSMVACSSLINILLGTSDKCRSTTFTIKVVEVSSLRDRLTFLQKQLESQIGEASTGDISAHGINHREYAYEEERHINLMQIIETKLKVDMTITIISPLICPVLDGSTDDKRVDMTEVREGKTIVLLISSLDIVEEELFKLKRCYNEKKTRSELHYEIVWIPVVDSSDEASQAKFKTKMKELKMPWYIVADPWSIDPVLIRYMKEVWNFSKKLIAVVVDSHGKVVCKNALNMFTIWGNRAYPFTPAKEKSLWEGEITWKNELLMNIVDQSIEISEETSICLYGGSDAKWIDNFITEAQNVAKTAQIKLEMFYAGKRKADEQVKKIKTDIEAGKICGRLLPHQTYFWIRLESLLESIQNIDSKTVKVDRILRELSEMLSFGESDKGWAVICKGSTDMVSARGDTIMKILKNLSAEEIKEKGLVPALSESIGNGMHRKKDHSHSHCNRTTIPWPDASIAEKWLCADCGRPMEKYLMYCCCMD